MLKLEGMNTKERSEVSNFEAHTWMYVLTHYIM